ncbi:MAG: hypothetical protein GY856_12010 [bacterium]|nr:hypothetical protein [bacterium]
MERAMTVEEVLSRLRRLDVVLRTDGDRLRFSAPRGNRPWTVAFRRSPTKKGRFS